MNIRSTGCDVSISCAGIRLLCVAALLALPATTKAVDWTPADTTTLVWYDAADADTITASGGAVSQWNNKSAGGGFPMVQVTEANKPLTGSSTIGGLNTILFDGSNDSLQTAANPFGASIANAFVFFVLDIKTIAQSTTFSLSGSSSVRWQAHCPWEEGTVYFDCGGSSGANRISGATGWSANRQVMMGFYCSVGDNVQRVYTNGTLFLWDDSGHTVSTAGGMALGSDSSSSFDNVAIGEVVVINSTVSTDTRQKVEGYLAWKWGLQGNLPADHPYKAAKPTTTPAATMTAFGLPGNPATISGNNVTLYVASGTDVTTLAPTYTLSQGATCDKASGSVQNFTSPVQYRVISADTLVTNDYVVTVNVVASETDIDWSAGDGAWDAGTVNWRGRVSGLPVLFVNDGSCNVNFTNAAGGTIAIATDMAPSSTTVNATSGTYTFNGGPISGEGSLTKSGGGTLRLNNANSYTGGTTLSGGTLRLLNNGAIGTGTLTINAGTTLGALWGSGVTIMLPDNPIVLNGSFTHPDDINEFNFGNGAVTLNNPITIDTVHRVTFGGTITGPGGLNALDIAANGGNDSGVVFTSPITLRAGQTATTYNAGAYLLANGAIGDDGNGYGLAVTGSGTLGLAASNTFTGTLTINSGARVNLGWNGTTGTLSPGSPLVDNGTLNFYRTDTLTQGADFNSVISGTGAVIQQGNGTTVLNGANSYSGMTTVNAGTLSISSIRNVGGGASAVGAPTTAANGTINFANATILYTGAGDTTDRLFNLTGNGTIKASGTTTAGSPLEITSTIYASGDNRTLTLAGTGVGKWAGVIANSYVTTLIKSEAGIWILSGANTHSGDTTISAGTLEIGNNLALQNSALVPGGTLTFSAGVNTPTFGGLLGGTGLTLPANVTALTLNPATGATKSYSGILAEGSAGMTLTKTGGGTQVLSGVNTYTGATTVNAGFLKINSPGSLHASSAVTVTGGSLGGTGTVGGGVTLNGTGGVDLRDNGIGTLTLNGNLAISGAAGANNLYFDLSNNGTTTDKIIVGGTTSMTTPGAAVIFLNQIGSRIQNGTYTLIQGTGAVPAASNFTLAAGKAFGLSFSLGVTGNNLQLTTTQSDAGPASPAWTGGTSASWNNAGNWTSAAVPGYQSNVSFYNPGAGNLSTTLDTDFDINSLTYAAGATSATTIAAGSGGVLTIEGSGITVNTPDTGTVTHTINANVGLAASQTWTVNPSATLTVGGAVTDLTGGCNLAKGGAGVLNLNGSTTLGSLEVAHRSGISASFGTVSVGSGGAMSVGYGPSSSVYIGVGTGTGNVGQQIGTLDVSAASSFVANVGIFRVGGTVGGVGYAYLGANNTITAATEFGVCHGDWGFPNGYGTVTTAAGGATTIHTPRMYFGYNTPNGTTGGWGRFTLGNGATLNVDGLSSGRTTLFVGVANSQDPSGASYLELSGGGTGVANLRLSSLLIGQSQGGSPNVSGTLTISSSVANSLDISGTGNVVLIGDSAGSGGAPVGALTFGGGTGAVISTDNSTAILIGNKRSSGGITGTLNLLGGTLTITTTGSAIAGGGGASSLNCSDVTLIAGTSSTNWISGLTSATLTNTVTFSSGTNSIVIPQVLSGNGNLVKTGIGSLTLSGTNTYTGATTVSNGTLLVSGSITSAVTVASGGAIGGTGTINNNVTLLPSGQAVLTQGKLLTITGSLALNGNTVRVNLSGSEVLGQLYPIATYNPTGSTGAFAQTATIESGRAEGAPIIVTDNGTVYLKIIQQGTMFSIE